MGVGSSGEKGNTCTSCIKKFIVNFRRPSDYRGQYGFDWLREEYIYPVYLIVEKNNDVLPLSLNVSNLKKEYRKDVPNPITPYGQEYFPAWLSLFSYIEKSTNPNVSDMTKNGAQLDLHIEEIETLKNDGTQILLESSNPFLKITPKKINISEVLKSKKKIKKYGSKSVNYYHLIRKVNVKCTGGFLEKHEQIRVYAKRNEKKIEIGKLMVYRNDKIKHADLVIIPLITEYQNGQPVKPNRLDDYEFQIKKIAFNQALIRAEIKREAVFDLTKYQSDPLVRTVLQANNSMDASTFAQGLRDVYNNYGPVKVNGGIDENGKGFSASKKTFIFITTKQTRAGGVCTLDGHVWGDMMIVFNSNLEHAHTYPHELGHSFSLPHTFQTGSFAKHSFYRGYTDNYMDYGTTNPYYENNKLIYNSRLNPHHVSKKGYPFTFFKWQWDVMRNDKSMR